MLNLFLTLLVIRAIATGLSLRGSSTPSPLDTLNSVWGIDISSSPIYHDYKKAKKDLDYIGKETKKIGTKDVPEFRKRSDGTGWDDLEDNDLLASNNKVDDEE
jgi:hypothetical protein